MPQVYPTISELIGLRFKATTASFQPKQTVHSLLSGTYSSRLRGRGITFEELRNYHAGDDIRSIDWKASARLRSTQVRVYTEEKDRPVLLVVDQRLPMFFGSQRATKAKTATEIAALAAWRTIARGDRIGSIIFGEKEISRILPHRSRTNVMRICNELVRFNRKLNSNTKPHSANQLNQALQSAINIAHHDHLVILITDCDGRDETTKKLVTKLVSHNDVLAVLVYDPLGAQLPNDESLQITDGRTINTIPADRSFPEQFQAAFEENCVEICESFSSLRIPILPICTHDPVPEQVLRALGKQG